jgi:acetylglutamate kinase
MATGVTVVKVGGNEVEDAAWVGALAARLGGARPLVVVHGGGREVSALQQRFGVEPEWRDGLRVSSAETVRIVSMVLNGVVNKRLVGALIGAGVDALGISGEDGALITAEPAQAGALGRTGVVQAVRADLLVALLRLGMVPVVAPVSRGIDGAPLNVNADDAASAIAIALGAERLLFVSNVAGVLDGASALDRMDVSEVELAIAGGVVTGGMAPKARAAARAAQAGVSDVRIGGLDVLDGAAGTRFLAALEVVA